MSMEKLGYDGNGNATRNNHCPKLKELSSSVYFTESRFRIFPLPLSKLSTIKPPTYSAKFHVKTAVIKLKYYNIMYTLICMLKYYNKRHDEHSFIVFGNITL